MKKIKRLKVFEYVDETSGVAVERFIYPKTGEIVEKINELVDAVNKLQEESKPKTYEEEREYLEKETLKQKNRERKIDEKINAIYRGWESRLTKK